MSCHTVLFYFVRSLQKEKKKWRLEKQLLILLASVFLSLFVALVWLFPSFFFSSFVLTHFLSLSSNNISYARLPEEINMTTCFISFPKKILCCFYSFSLFCLCIVHQWRWIMATNCESQINLIDANTVSIKYIVGGWLTLSFCIIGKLKKNQEFNQSLHFFRNHNEYIYCCCFTSSKDEK